MQLRPLWSIWAQTLVKWDSFPPKPTQNKAQKIQPVLLHWVSSGVSIHVNCGHWLPTMQHLNLTDQYASVNQ